MKNYNEITGRVDSIYCGSAVDGKGLRVVIFLSGCNLRCPFCHNPETLYNDGKCYSVGEIVARVLRYKNYIKNGGVTISGGEPLIQREFVLAIIKSLLAYKIKTVIETNGTIIDKDIIELSDYFIIDVKNQSSFNKTIYQDLLKEIESAKKQAVLSCVIVPSVNDSEEKIKELRELKEEFPSVITRIKLLPFRKLCVEKYKKLSLEFPYNGYDECDKSTIDRLQKYL